MRSPHLGRFGNRGWRAQAQHWADAEQPSLWRHDAPGNPLPGAGSDGQEALPHAWRGKGVGRTARQPKCAQARPLHGREQRISGACARIAENRLRAARIGRSPRSFELWRGRCLGARQWRQHDRIRPPLRLQAQHAHIGFVQDRQERHLRSQKPRVSDGNSVEYEGNRFVRRTLRSSMA